MSKDEQDATVGRLRRERREFKLAKAAAEAELQKIKDQVIALLEAVPNVSSSKFHMEMTTVSGPGLNLQRVEQLLEEREALTQKLFTCENSLKDLHELD